MNAMNPILVLTDLTFLKPIGAVCEIICLILTGVF